MTAFARSSQTVPAGSAPAPTARRALSPFGEPVVFAGSMGLLYPGRSDVAVLMLGPVGYEELCLRASWQRLAEGFSQAGIACLRFDYPGQGAAPEPEATAGLDDWFATIRAAAALLRDASGCERLVLVGHGLGAALALQVAQALAPLAGIVLMAPVAQGRRYRRELSVWSHMLCDRIGIGPDPDDDTGCAVAGIRIAPGRLKAIVALTTEGTELPAGTEILLVARPGHAGDEALAETLTAALADPGGAVTRMPYQGHDLLTIDPTAARPPLATLEGVLGWVRARATATAASLASPTTDAVLRGDGFVETPFRFGPGGRLLGILCEPAGMLVGAPVLFVNAGRDYHIGWARVTVHQARCFARLGIASLRFDFGGVGDSPAASDAPAEFLYSQSQIDDVVSAIDALEARGLSEPILIGRCSGAYAAFNAAVADERVRRLVLINNERFVWDPDESVDDAIRYAHRSVGDFGATLRSRAGLRRLLTGQLRIGPAARHILYRWLKRVSVSLAPLLGPLTKHGRLHRECHRRMAVLAAREADVHLLYADGDVGLKEFATYFGAGGERLAAYPRTSLGIIAGADHNFTHRAAAGRLLSALCGIVTR